MDLEKDLDKEEMCFLRKLQLQVRRVAFWTSVGRQSYPEPKGNHFSLVPRQDRAGLASVQVKPRKTYFVYLYLHAYLCVYHMYSDAHRGQKRT